MRDRANDAIRADGREIRAKVIGEGGNLGCTQRGRVEYAQSGGPEKAGGRINTDFIDNSAGVNTSDLEVNIKILLADVARKGQLTRAGARQTARQHDRRSRRAGAAQQLPAEPGAVGARAARTRAAHRIPEPDPRAGARRPPEPRHRVPARRR